MSRNDPQVNIRLPVDLKERLEAAALQNQRSFKAEIVSRLETTFTREPTLADIYTEVIALRAEIAKEDS